jgi:hypothetical protein
MPLVMLIDPERPIGQARHEDDDAEDPVQRGIRRQASVSGIVAEGREIGDLEAGEDGAGDLGPERTKPEDARDRRRILREIGDGKRRAPEQRGLRELPQGPLNVSARDHRSTRPIHRAGNSLYFNHMRRGFAVNFPVTIPV